MYLFLFQRNIVNTILSVISGKGYLEICMHNVGVNKYLHPHTQCGWSKKQALDKNTKKHYIFSVVDKDYNHYLLVASFS